MHASNQSCILEWNGGEPFLSLLQLLEVVQTPVRSPQGELPWAGSSCGSSNDYSRLLASLLFWVERSVPLVVHHFPYDGWYRLSPPFRLPRFCLSRDATQEARQPAEAVLAFAVLLEADALRTAASRSSVGSAINPASSGEYGAPTSATGFMLKAKFMNCVSPFP